MKRDTYLIIHADDLGMAPPINAAIFESMDKGPVTSASIMVPSPWFPDVVAYAKPRSYDLGVHLTLTNEWMKDRWKPISEQNSNGNLVDAAGLFHRTLSAVSRASLAEVSTEISRQLLRARASGLNLSHLDSHMYGVFARLDWFQAYLALAKSYGLCALRLPGIWEEVLADETEPRPPAPILKPYQVNTSIQERNWLAFYCDIISSLEPGLNLLTVHPGFATDSLSALIGRDGPWSAGWRQRDYDALMSDTFRQHLKACGIITMAWRDVSGLSREQERGMR